MRIKTTFLSLMLSSIFIVSTAVNITYDSTSLLFDGQRKLVIFGAIHYPRSTPEMWPNLIQRAKDGGLDTIETYIFFWNHHEPQYRCYDFSRNLNFVKLSRLFKTMVLMPFLESSHMFVLNGLMGDFPFG